MTFITCLKDQIATSVWDASNATVVQVTKEGYFINIIDNFGQITYGEFLGFVKAYYDMPARQAQNALQMYECIKAFLSQEILNKINIESDKFVIAEIGNGPLLYKTLMDVMAVDTQATVAHMRKLLANLGSYIDQVDHDIEKFNEYVKSKIHF